MSRPILIVDDDRQMVETLCDVLRVRGWEAEGVFSGEAAIEAVRHKAYSVVVMDVKMPGLGGVAALKIMRAERPDLPVLLMTAYSSQELILEAEREGAVRVFPKPVDPAGLLQSLELTLKRARSILIIDDDPGSLRTLSEGLRARGFSTVEARTLDAAVRRLEAQRATAQEPAAVLLNLRLHDVTPQQSIVAIRDLSPATALILYGGERDTAGPAASAAPTGVSGWLQKPISVDRLVDILNEMIRS